MNKLNLIATALLTTVILGGCVANNETAGTVVGGITGAVVGNQFGKGTGQMAMTALGGMLGAVVGARVGASLDAQSKQQMAQSTVQALNSAPVNGEPITWDNQDNAGNPASGQVEILRQGQASDGATCREFRQTVMIGSEQNEAYGTACRDGNGDWQIRS